jgi:hypothetical protein
MASVSDFIELAPDETVVKEYCSFRMKKPQNATVNIAATNMRLILYGQSSRGRKTGRPTLTQEIRIEDIRGVEIYEKERPKIILIILGLFFIASAALLATNRLPTVYRILEGILHNGSYGILITAALGVILFASAFIFMNREFEFLVKGNSSNLNTGMFAEKTVFKEGIDSPKILRELGSIIIQIQKDREKMSDKFSFGQEKKFSRVYEMQRTGFDAEDVYEDEIESIFEVDEFTESKSKQEPINEAEYEQDVYAEVTYEQDIIYEKEREYDSETEESIEEIKASDKQQVREIIEEQFDRGRDKVNVDDILETMEKIENPTNKKKNDYL